MHERVFIYNELEYLQAAKQIKDSASRAKKQTCLTKVFFPSHFGID